jgi:hypothetical protein
MKISFKVITTSLMIFLISCAGTVDKPPALKPDSIGVVYLIDEDDQSVRVNIIFPSLQVIDYPSSFPGPKSYRATLPVVTEGQLVLFDDKGKVVTLDSLPLFQLKFWCENDGGEQFRPEAVMTIPKAKLKRPLKPDREIQGIACFAYLKTAQSQPLPNESVTSKSSIRMKGDLKGNASINALIWVDKDVENNCDGKPANNLTIHLKTQKFDQPLRCCGP